MASLSKISLALYRQRLKESCCSKCWIALETAVPVVKTVLRAIIFKISKELGDQTPSVSTTRG